MALKLGRTVAELERDMSAREYAEWWEFYSVEPFGFESENMLAGVVAASNFNAQRTRKSSPVAKASDFLLKTERESRGSETAKSLAFLRAVGKRVTV